jgi:signal peptidase I
VNGSAPAKGPRISVFTAAICMAVLVSLLAYFAWTLAGGRLLVMSTPSMCPNACVGSLVAIRPLTGVIHHGQLISFRPPGQNQIFTHRVERVFANGSFTTKGDAETYPDPWIITRAEVVGRVSFTVSGLGWWLRALPIVAIGCALLLFVRGMFAPRSRRTFERLFCTAIVVLPIDMLRPLVNGDVIQTGIDRHHHGWATSLVVNTGLLPARFAASAGRAISRLAPSRLGLLSGPLPRGSAMMMRDTASLPGWIWVVVTIAVFSPLLGCLYYTLRTPDVVEESPVQEDDPDMELLELPQREPELAART